MKKGITEFLLSHKEKEPVSFHMPGHKGSSLYKACGYGTFLEEMIDLDITEIPGADNLFQTESIIRETMDKYRKIYECEESYLLINGSSAGLIAAILATIGKGDELVLGRNCHKAVFNGLAMAGGKPVYAYPEMAKEYGISGEITLDEIAACLEKAPNSKAVLITSPNYYGICSDIKSMARYVHQKGKLLIVDQAHGAHLKLFSHFTKENIPCAEESGADIVINSTHKTLASLTQSAVLNICSDKVDKRVIEDKLQLIESTSPSYLLMASLDINADIILEEGETLTRNWVENLDYFYEEASKIPGLAILSHPLLDRSKINISMEDCGLDGHALEEELMKRNIFIELVSGNLLMCMSGIGNKRADFEKLLCALREIGKERKPCHKKYACSQGNHLVPAKGEIRKIPREKERIFIDEAAGRVCAEAIIPYPPGIPLVCPGEVITKEAAQYAKALREKGEKVIGVDGEMRVAVGEER